MHIDQKYIDFLKNNDRRGIQGIYEKYASSVVGLVLKNSGSEEEAYDVLQESLVDIYHMAKDKDFQLTTRFSNFLLLVCKRKWLNVLKKKKRREVTNLEDRLYTLEDQSQAEYKEAVKKSEEENLVLELIETMGESCRNIIISCLQEDVSQQEVACRLNISYAYLRKKKSECMKKLGEMVRSHPYFKKA